MPSVAPLPLLRPSALTHSTRSVRRGEIVLVGRGVYAPQAEWDALTAWERDLARVHAHLLVAPDDVLCLESAALLWGLPVVGTGHPVHVLASDRATSRRSGNMVVHTSAHDDRVIDEAAGVRLTSRADTCVDIARSRHPAAGLVVADAAVRADPIVGAMSLVTLNEESLRPRTAGGAMGVGSGGRPSRIGLRIAEPRGDRVVGLSPTRVAALDRS